MSAPALEVGRRIALLRRRLGLSQVAFARQAGISRNALLEYERGTRVPKAASLTRIADAGGVSIEWLLNGQRSRAGGREDPELEAAVVALRTPGRASSSRDVRGPCPPPS